jgi:hypothetical protein
VLVVLANTLLTLILMELTQVMQNLLLMVLDQVRDTLRVVVPVVWEELKLAGLQEWVVALEDYTKHQVMLDKQILEVAVLVAQTQVRLVPLVVLVVLVYSLLGKRIRTII